MDTFGSCYREWRQAGGHQPGKLSTSQAIHDPIPSPTVSASRKKQKLTHLVPPQSFTGPSPSFHQQTIASPHQPSSSVAKRGAIPTTKGKKQKSVAKQYQTSVPSGRSQVANRVSSGAIEAAEGASLNPFIGRKVRTRWPDDNNFYEAVITDYNAAEVNYLLLMVY